MENMNAYDFDNTVFYGDSTAKFYIFELKRHPKIILKTPSLFGAFAKYYIFRKGSKTDFKQTMYRFLTCIKDIDGEVEAFWNINIDNIKPFYLEQKKTDDVIISASPEFLLFPVCKKLGLKYLIASRVDKNTGKYNGINCHGKEKVRRYYEEFGETDVEEFYSDSYSDTPMAEIAIKAFMVKKDEISPWDFEKK